MTEFDPFKKLNQALELSATAKLMQQLQKSPFDELVRRADSLGRADWASRTILKELESIDRLKRYLDPAESAANLSSHARAMQLLTQQPSVRLLEQVEAFSKRMDAFARQPKHLVDQLDRFEKLTSTRLSQSLKQLDAFQAAIDARSSWDRYTEVAASLERLHERSAIPPALAQWIERLDRATRGAEAAGVDEVALVEVGLEQREQAAAAFEALVQEAESAPTSAEQVDRIIAAIEASQDTTRQRIFWSIVVVMLLNLMFAVVNPISDFYIKKRLEQVSSPQEATKVVKQEARKSVDDIRLFSDYRFVSVPIERPLVVRSQPGAKSPRIGELRFSQVVYVVETTKEKDFTLIEWRSEDGTSSVKGWVFSRYLKKFT